MIYTAILSTAFYNLILGNFDPLKTQLKLMQCHWASDSIQKSFGVTSR